MTAKWSRCVKQFRFQTCFRQGLILSSGQDSGGRPEQAGRCPMSSEFDAVLVLRGDPSGKLEATSKALGAVDT